MLAVHGLGRNIGAGSSRVGWIFLEEFWTQPCSTGPSYCLGVRDLDSFGICTDWILLIRIVLAGLAVQVCWCWRGDGQVQAGSRWAG